MKLTRGLLSLGLIVSVGFVSFFSLGVHRVIAQDGRIALERGYRTGYSDGYMAGYQDTIDKLAKDYSKHSDYQDGNRAYNKDFGSAEDYKDGYQQGFETGYNSGYEKKSFDSSLPQSLIRRPAKTAETTTPAGTSDSAAVQQTDTSATQAPTSTTTDTAAIQQTSYTPASDAAIIILKDTDLVLQLQDRLSTASNRAGDKFTAKIVSPIEISGAIIEGRVDKVTKPGRLKRRSELTLSFDRIVLNEKRWANFNAMLTEVMPVKGDNVRRVDNEGTAVGKSSMKPDIIKVGAATGTGTAVGAVAGGPVGAAVGAGVGAAFGVGAVVIQRGKNIELNKNQQIRIKTGYEIQIR